MTLSMQAHKLKAVQGTCDICNLVETYLWVRTVHDILEGLGDKFLLHVVVAGG